MPIKAGDKLPNATFRVMTADGPKPKTTDEIFKGKKVALFGVPGAFTPTCNNLHLPSFLNNAALAARCDRIVRVVDGRVVLLVYLRLLLPPPAPNRLSPLPHQHAARQDDPAGRLPPPPRRAPAGGPPCPPARPRCP